jgi:integrase
MMNCGTRKIRVHALRHTTASLLKDLGVPARDTQMILGHAHISTTQQIYTHVDEVARRDALTRLNKLLGGSES